MADKLAKLAVNEHRMPKQIRIAMRNHEALQNVTALWVATATLRANSAETKSQRDAEASREVALELRRLRGSKAKKVRQKPAVTLRPVALGGHRLRWFHQRWQCSLCREWSAKRASTAAKTCNGSVTMKWAAKARVLVVSGSAVGSGHHFVLSGEVLWCRECGAFAERHAMALAEPWPTSAHTEQAELLAQDGRNGRRSQLKRLREGVHLKTRCPLSPPVSVGSLAATPAELVSAFRKSNAGIVYAAAAPLNPCMVAMFSRVRGKEVATKALATSESSHTPTVVRRVVARSKRERSPQLDVNRRAVGKTTFGSPLDADNALFVGPSGGCVPSVPWVVARSEGELPPRLVVSRRVMGTTTPGRPLGSDNVSLAASTSESGAKRASPGHSLPLPCTKQPIRDSDPPAP